MIYAVISLAILNVILVALIYAIETSNAQERADRAGAYEKTLQIMADRVQAPERLPVRETSELVIPTHEPDEWATVGRVDRIADDYGLTD